MAADYTNLPYNPASPAAVKQLPNVGGQRLSASLLQTQTQVPAVRAAAAPGNPTAARNPVVQAIVQQARAAGVDPALMVAVAMEESSLNPRATGDQGTSFGLYQLHQGGALGRLSPEQAYDPATNAGVIARSIAQAGGRGWRADAAGLSNYYRVVGRGSSVSGPTQKVLGMLPQVQALLGGTAAGGQTPPVGSGIAASGYQPRIDIARRGG